MGQSQWDLDLKMVNFRCLNVLRTENKYIGVLVLYLWCTPKSCSKWKWERTLLSVGHFPSCFICTLSKCPTPSCFILMTCFIVCWRQKPQPVTSSSHTASLCPQHLSSPPLCFPRTMQSIHGFLMGPSSPGHLYPVLPHLHKNFGFYLFSDSCIFVFLLCQYQLSYPSCPSL